MEKLIRLPIYGLIDHSGADYRLSWELFQTSALARSRDISLSSAPARCIPQGMPASRFAHSVAVSTLARSTARRNRRLSEHEDLLVASALCHDLGSPPFSHVAEPFSYARFGRTHEEDLQRLLRPGTELDQVLRQFDVDPAQVLEVVTGRHPDLGPLLAGSIDLDNADNSLHLLVSFGWTKRLPYQPQRLVKAFGYDDDGMFLRTEHLDDVLGWAKARRRLYSILRAEPNRSTTSMVYRAIDLAEAQGSVPDAFFEWGESEALIHLQRHAGPDAAAIIEAALSWRHYPQRYERTSRHPDPRVSALYANVGERRRVADLLADELGAPRRHICLYAGVDKAEKAISLPWRGPDATGASMLFQGRSPRQAISVFAHRAVEAGRATIAAVLDELLETVEPVTAAKAFF